MESTMNCREQVGALVALLFAIVAVNETPVLVTAYLGHGLPPELMAMSDKAVTGLVGVLGTVAGLVFRQSRTDEVRANNTGAAFRAIEAAANAQPGTVRASDIPPAQ